MSGSIDERELIKLVEPHRILYDRRLSRSPQNVALKQKIWREVSTQLNASEHSCIMRWRNLRDRFGREYRRLIENSESVATWYLFPDLLFLKYYYKTGNVSTSDVVLQFKYAPKPKKRKVSHTNESSNDDLDTDVLLFNQQLIGLVKEYPVLYHRQAIRNFKNLTLKNKAWQEISENMGATEALCYERWKLLRDKFARLCRQQQLQSRKPILWAHYRDMQFLEEHYRKGIPLNVSSRKHETSSPTNTGYDDCIEMDKNAEDELHMLIEAVQSDDECIEAIEATVEQSESYADETNVDIEVEDAQTVPVIVPNADVYIEVNNNAEEEAHTITEAMGIDDVYDEVVIDAQREEEDNDYIEISNKESTETLNETVELCSSLQVEPLPASIIDNNGCPVDPTTKLAQLISSMQTALKESQDCVIALQQQPQAAELSKTANTCTDRTMLHKILVLLEGLSPANRLKAEQEMLKFLEECELRRDMNLDIDDLDAYDDL